MTTIGPTKTRLLRILAVAAAAAGMQACGNDRISDIDDLPPEVREELLKQTSRPSGTSDGAPGAARADT